ncbi:hypothetical protein ACFX1X_000167 [Malus domestica]
MGERGLAKRRGRGRRARTAGLSIREGYLEGEWNMNQAENLHKVHVRLGDIGVNIEGGGGWPETAARSP